MNDETDTLRAFLYEERQARITAEFQVSTLKAKLALMREEIGDLNIDRLRLRAILNGTSTEAQPFKEHPTCSSCRHRAENGFCFLLDCYMGSFDYCNQHEPGKR